MTVFKGRFLQVWEEAVGQLQGVREDGGYCLAAIGPVCVALPAELAVGLRNLQGRKVGVLRCDNGYRLRIIGESNVC